MAFITLEGIEGSGKSTQGRRLGAHLGPDTVLTHEPGATALGRAIRGLLLDTGRGAMSAEAEVLLFFADRAQHVAEIVRPALEAGQTVISDRYTDSSMAYQGFGRGIDRRLIEVAAEAATGGLRPDLILLFDVPVDVGLERAARRGTHDRLEGERFEFHDRVRRGYLALAAEEPERWVRIDATASPDTVHEQVIAAVEARGLMAGHGVR